MAWNLVGRLNLISTQAETGSKAATYAEGFDDGLISPEGQDDALAARLWDRSRDLVNI